MGYQALKKMQKKNKENYGISGVPHIPKAHTQNRDAEGKWKDIGNLEKKVQEFIRDACEDLNFKTDDKHSMLFDLDGKSLEKNQIPYNMEMDLNRLCLENAIHRFVETGITQDAFDVYFCYLEMFIGEYQKSKRMVEMLGEFESNAGSLLLKHRDHYTHSVYVFLIGLALYQSNEDYKIQYQKFYRLGDEKTAAHHFLKFWGLSALFHDIGYPFEIPFEQVKSYFVGEDKKPFIVYRNMKDYVNLEKGGMQWEKLMLGEDTFMPQSLNDILAHNIAYRMEQEYQGYEKFQMYKCERERKEEQMNSDKLYQEYLSNEILRNKPEHPDSFNNYMDHAYFSAVILFKQLIEVIGLETMCADTLTTESYMDALTAIILHNSLYKFSITNYKKEYKRQRLDVKNHPLAYLLMLCDELQCWNRISYGQNSRNEVHAMDCEFKFEENEIHATYLFDKCLEGKAKRQETRGSYKNMVELDTEYSDKEVSKFLADIEKIVRINDHGFIKLSISVEFRENNRRRNLYLSSSNFIHLYEFAIALNGRYNYNGREEQIAPKDLEKDFNKLSLEYKLSNIGQAKALAGHLEAIGCFYTDRAVAYPMLLQFTDDDMEIIGSLEHERWVREHEQMGWGRMTQELMHELKQKLESPQLLKNIREQTRMHPLMMEGELNSDVIKVHYQQLEEEDQNKDTAPMNSMLVLINKYDGLRIYRQK